MGVTQELKVTYCEGGDAHGNLALEEFLFRTGAADSVHVLFYRHRPAVVFGRNQNPWVEFDVATAVERGLTLARRISGGGTVYHDQGNLNYSFMMPRSLYDPKRFLGMVTEALLRLGVSTAACDRSSVWIAGEKVSGTAFMLTGKRALLHGCILVDSDLDSLRTVLRAPGRAIETKAVSSVRAPVTSLVRHVPKVTSAAIPPVLAEVAARHLGLTTVTELAPPRLTQGRVAEYLARQRSVEWVLGRTSEFRHILRTRYGGLTLSVKRGLVSGIEGADGGFSDMLQARLLGQPYDGAMLSRALGLPGGAEARLRVLAETIRREIPAVWSSLAAVEAEARSRTDLPGEPTATISEYP